MNGTIANKSIEICFNKMFEHSPIGVALVNKDGILVSVNKALEDILGYSATELTTMSVSEFTHPDDIDNDMMLHKQVLNGDIKNYQIEKRFLTKEGVEVWGILSVSLANISENETAYALRMVEDITKRKHSEQKLHSRENMRKHELDEARKKLLRNERLTTLGKISGEIGHELRNPLGAMKNALYLLEMIIEDPDPDVQESLEILDDEIANCESIVSTLLDYARPTKPSIHKVELDELIRKSIEKCEVPSNVEVEISFDEKIPTILGDPQKLKQVFINLVKNAYQAMPDGGQIDIRSTYNGTSVLIEIRDTGIGMDSETIDNLYEPLFSTKTHGIGLGMDIVRKIVEAHDGTIDVESVVGQGTTFRIELPTKRKKDEQQ